MSTDLVSVNPHDPTDIVAQESPTTPSDVAAAVTAARDAGRKWSDAGPAARSAALESLASRLQSSAGELVDLVVREVGKPRQEAKGEIGRATAIIRYYAQQALDPSGQVFPTAGHGLSYTRARPHGVAGLITPWNFPLAIPLWKAAPALAVGNAVVLKPSSEALATARFLERLARECLPADLFTLVPGEADTGSALIDSADVVSFTGSTAVGRSVAEAAARRGVPVQTEMGGQNPAIVLPDADPSEVATLLIAAAMGFAGQKCTATSRIITVGGSETLVTALDVALADLRSGDPSDPGVSAGPVINGRARDAVATAIIDAHDAGGRIHSSPAHLPEEGFYVAPTFVECLDPTHPLNQEETFGPFATVIEAASVTEAIDLANRVDYGLVASVHGRDLHAIMQAASTLDVGMVKVNAMTTGVDFHMPFGGDKESSRGPREQGKAALDFYAKSQTVSLMPGSPGSTPAH